MYLSHLTLNNFKNIAELSIDFSPKINCFLGDNGMGKSNLLDAIHYLSFCRSFTGMTDMQLIRQGEDFTTAAARYMRRDTPEQLTLGITRGKRKCLKRGGKEYVKLSQHIGAFPAVMVAPRDIDLIQGPAEERRRWMDMVISQSDARYLDALIRYNSGLEQRNRLLRANIVDHTLYDAIENAMEAPARYIHRTRAEWINRLQTIFTRYYSAIAGSEADNITLRYIGALDASADGSLKSLLDRDRRHDEIVKYTSVGPHRDDVEMLLHSLPMRKAASQGQCKTFTVALRLAQYDFLHQATSIKPLLLLDDIFDKLDSNRVESIMNIVTGDEFGQIFVTDTNRDHLDSIMSHTGGDYRMWTVSHGSFTPTHSHPESE
ncbi:MAG: DNA replication and repair protein RecF [Paramuribaculum sp.]|nr:DNA replication and repair protein RecF [Paramuribaculum sp.]